MFEKKYTKNTFSILEFDSFLLQVAMPSTSKLKFELFILGSLNYFVYTYEYLKMPTNLFTSI